MKITPFATPVSARPPRPQPVAASSDPYEKFVTSPDSANLGRVGQEERREAFEILQKGLPWQHCRPQHRANLLGQTMGVLAVDLVSEARTDSSVNFGGLTVRANFRKSQLGLTLPGVARDLVRYFHQLTPDPTESNFGTQLRAAQDAARIRSSHLDAQPEKLAQFERLTARLRAPWLALWVVQQNLSVGQQQLLSERLGMELPSDLKQASEWAPRLVQAIQELPSEVEAVTEPSDEQTQQFAAQVLKRFGRSPSLAADLCTWAHKYRQQNESHPATIERLARAEFLTGSIHGLEGVSPERQRRLMELRLAGLSRQESLQAEPEPIELEAGEDCLRVGDHEVAINHFSADLQGWNLKR